MRAFGVVVLLAMTGCGEGGVPVEAWTDAQRDWQCRYYAQCGLVADVATCHATNIGRFWLNPWILWGVDDGRIDWNADAAERCLDQQISCDFTSRAHWLRCDPLTAGTLHDGETCAIGAECISQECWIQEGCTNLCCKGVCVGETRPERGRIGDACRFAECLEGYCNGSECVALLPEGALCTDAEACQEGTACVRDDAGADAHCIRLPATGEPCTRLCALAGDRCTSRGICERGKLAGEACLQDNDCSRLYACGPAQRCVDPGVATGEDCSRYGRCASLEDYCDLSTSRCERLAEPLDSPPTCGTD